MLKFKLENQIIKRTDHFLPVADSRNYLKAEFALSEEWQGEIVAVFGYDGSFYNVFLDDNNCCVVPWEVIKAPVFTVSLFCESERLVTANVATVEVEASGLKEGTESMAPTPEIWQQYMSKMQRSIESSVPHIGENGNWFKYDVKTETYVDTGKSAQGDVGPQGPQGEKGETGDVGPQGPQGEKGETGDVGPQGPQGEKGETGDVGPQGPQGEKGETGDVGPQGPQGEKGETGDIGPQGPQGLQGIQGPVGPKGDTGEQGVQGDKGEMGPQGPKGDTGEKGDPGADGKDGVDGLTPYIGENGNWWIGDIDTGVKAEGKDGVNANETVIPLWQPNTEYNVGDVVCYVSTGGYMGIDRDVEGVAICKEAHTSTSMLEILEGGILWDFTSVNDSIMTRFLMVFNEPNDVNATGFITGKQVSDLIQSVDEVEQSIEILDQGVTETQQYVDETKQQVESLQYYGNSNVIPSDASIFSFITDSETMTASVTLTDAAKKSGENIDIVVPYKYINADNEEFIVTAIGDNAFDSGYVLSAIHTVNIPNCVTSIGSYAFLNCDVMKSVNIPDSVIGIVSGAFSGCSGKIVCAAGSYADTYAQENSIKVEYTNAATKGYVDKQIGNIETTLDGIIAIQNELMGVSE